MTAPAPNIDSINLDQSATEQFKNLDFFAASTDLRSVTERLNPIENDTKAEDHLRCLRYWQTQVAEIDAHADAEIERINRWRESRQRSPNSKYEYHRRCLEWWFEGDERKTAKLINGIIKSIRGRERVEIIDADAVPQKFLAETISTRPDKKLILDTIKSTGEIPDGCDLVRGEDTVKIEVSNV